MSTTKGTKTTKAPKPKVEKTEEKKENVNQPAPVENEKQEDSKNLEIKDSGSLSPQEPVDKLEEDFKSKSEDQKNYDNLLDEEIETGEFKKRILKDVTDYPKQAKAVYKILKEHFEPAETEAKKTSSENDSTLLNTEVSDHVTVNNVTVPADEEYKAKVLHERQERMAERRKTGR